MRRRTGITLIDQLLVLIISAILLAIAGLRLSTFRDALAVRAAREAVRDAFALARQHAISSGQRTAVRLSTAGQSAVMVHSHTDTLQRLALGERHGITLGATRDSMAYLPSGLGYGAANLRVTFQRGERADTLFVSRLGRVR